MKHLASIFTLILFFVGVSDCAFAQAPLVKMWDKRFGGTEEDWLSCFQQTSDGGYILGGESRSDSSGDKSQAIWGTFGNPDYWIVKIDSNGNKQWDKRFGGTGADELHCLQQTKDRGFILGGRSDSDSSGDKTQPNWSGWPDYWIVKTDSLGNKEWDKRFGGTDWEFCTSIQQTKDDGYIVGGWSTSGNDGDKTQQTWDTSGNPLYTCDYWIVKMDSVGNKEWDKRFGGIGNDCLNNLQQTTDGGYILGGQTSSSATGDKSQTTRGGDDYWIVKIDSVGNKEWDKRFGGYSEDRLKSLQQTFDKGYILCGTSYTDSSGDKTQPSQGFQDYWVVKVDSIGNKEWDKRFGGIKEEDFFGNISQTIDGGYLLAGESYSPLSGDKTENNLGGVQTWILLIDSIGNKLWDKTIFTKGVDEKGFAINTNGAFYTIANCTKAGVGGYKTQPNWNSANATKDYWIIKFCDTISYILPLVNFSASDSIFCDKHCLSFADRSIKSPIDWHWYFPSAVPDTSTAQNPTNICYNNYGSFDVSLVACNAAGCDSLFLPGFITELQNPPAPVITQSGDTLLSSPFYSYKWIETGNPNTTLSTDSIYVTTLFGNYYVIGCDSFGCCTPSNVIVISGLNDMVNKKEIGVVPNPSTDVIAVVTHTLYANSAELKVVNTTGQVVFQKTEENVSGTFTEQINVAGLANGIYSVMITADNKIATARFAVQH